MTRRTQASWSGLLQRLHRDEKGAVTLETVLLLAAIALPVLIFMIKFGWPKIWDLFVKRSEDLERETDKVIGGT